jgi:polysaccharide pyruvyl transferase CsaB
VRAVVAGWIGSTNLGDELVYDALAAKLRARGVDPVAISVDPDGTRATHGTRAIPATDPVRQWRAAGLADALLFGGGGLLQDETSPLNLPYHLARTLPYRLRGRPVGLVGLGVGALSTRLGRSLVQLAVDRRWPVSVRDEASAELAVSLGLPRPVLAADLVFSRPTPTVTRTDEVVVALRPQVARGRLLPASMRWQEGLGDEAWVRGLAARLDAVCDATGLRAHLVAFQSDRDGALHEAVADRMRHDARLSAPGVSDAAAVVGSARLVVGMRFHACVLATIAGVPSVALAYSSKVRALADELGAGGAAVPVTDTGLARLAELALQVVEGGDDVAAARETLRARERGNDRVLDEVLSAAG